MAVTQPPDRSERQQYPWTGLAGESEGAKVETWFEQTIWMSPEICSHCFARLRTRSTVEKDDWGNVVEETVYAEAAVEGWDLEDPPGSAQSIHPLARERTTCGECGSVGGLASSDALPKAEAVDRVPELVARLEELGHVVDTDRVYRTVRRLKSDQDRSDDDKRVFATAAAMGIKYP
jgi:hypothetical protein